jgi:glycosyltransferase involved in cell wall biosynthesis
MRILYVNDAIAIWGGVERILVEKVNYLAENYGYEMFVVTTNQGSHPMPFSLSQKVTHKDLNIQIHRQYLYQGLLRIFMKIYLNYLFVKRLRSYIQEIQPDVIVSVRPMLTNTIVRANGSIPLVFESHSSYKGQYAIDSHFYTKLKVELSNWSARYAQRVVALTEGDASEWRKINSQVCVIPNIVHLNDSGNFSDCEAQSVIFVGRFSKQKDIKSLLDIWKMVHERKPNWQLQIYGGHGEEQDSLLPIIENMNANIHVHEPSSHIMNRYKESSILVMTSAYEPFGLALPEAMSCGIPVVAFDCPYGPSDIITNGEDGFIIPNRDTQLFAEKVCLLMDNPDLRKKMGKAGIASSRRYEAKLIMPQWKELLEQLTSKK